MNGESLLGTDRAFVKIDGEWIFATVEDIGGSVLLRDPYTYICQMGIGSGVMQVERHMVPFQGWGDVKQLEIRGRAQLPILWVIDLADEDREEIAKLLSRAEKMRTAKGGLIQMATFAGKQ